MECEPTRVNEILVGLDGVEVIGVEDFPGRALRVHVRKKPPRPLCGGCGGAVWVHEWRRVRLVDMPSFGRPVRLVQQTPLEVPGQRLRCEDVHRAGPGHSSG